MIGGLITNRHSKIEETILIKNKSIDLFYIVTKVGKSLGYEVTRGGEANSIWLGKTNPFFLLTGKQEHTDIVITDVPEGLAIVCQTKGDYGAGTKKSAKNILRQFKEKLLRRIEEEEAKQAK
jgi:hypothetical protein